MSARIYVEGGGAGELLDTLFRQGWSEFFRAAGLAGRMPRVVRGKGRIHTFDLFVTRVRHPRPGELPLLLVDSEEAVAPGRTVWQHLKSRPDDSWDRPSGVADHQAFLMVQVMVFLAIDRQSHSASDTLYGIFPYMVPCLMLLNWVASKSSTTA